MSNEQNIQKLDQIIQLATEVKNDLASTSTPPVEEVIQIPAGADVQSYINAAKVGAILELENTVYENTLLISKPLTLRAKNWENLPKQPSNDQKTTIIGNDDATIKIINQDASSWVYLQGLRLQNKNHDGDMIDVYGIQTIIDRCSCLGDPKYGAHRGILTNGKDTKITNIWVDHVFLPDRDTQAIGGYDGTNNLYIDGAYLVAAGETIMFGGANSASAQAMPRNITIKNFHFTKRREWFGKAQIKNAFELKSAENVEITDGLMEYAGTSQGQQGYIMLFTVRNDEGGSPWSNIKNVTVERINCRYAGACISVLGVDDLAKSGTLDNLTIRNVNFTDIDPTGITGGGGNCVSFHSTCNRVTLDSISISGRNLNSLGYFPPDGKQPKGLTLSNWKYPRTEYGWKIDEGGMDVPPNATNLKKYMPDMVYNITANDAGAVGYPIFTGTKLRTEKK